jgi:hypothetical protein
MMDEAQTLYGATITATQGSPNVGVGASAGTHDGEGVIDVTGADLDAIVTFMRQVGFAAWHRTRAEGFTPHVHGVAVGEPDLSSQAADQVDDYIAGRNGLASNAPDNGPRDWVGRTWEDYQAGNPGTGGAPVFRGAQLTVENAVVTAGSLDPSDVYNELLDREDATAVTLTVGDVFYIYVGFLNTTDGDVYSRVTWRLNARGHGVIALADSYDANYTDTVPNGWDPLGSVTLDRDTFGLTATAASPGLGEWSVLVNGGLMLRVTCVSGTVILDWACLQVEPPAGLLVVSGSHWSQYLTPAITPHSPAGAGFAVIEGAHGGTTGGGDVQGAVEAETYSAATVLATVPWAISFDPITESQSPYYVTVSAYVQGLYHNDGDGTGPVSGDLIPLFWGLQWGEFPDYRTTPSQLSSLFQGGEVVVIDGDPQYEFAAGATASVRWGSTVMTFTYLPLDDDLTYVNATIGFTTGLSGSGAPSFSPVATITDGDRAASVTDAPPAATDFVVSTRLSLFDGVGSMPRPGGWYVDPGNDANLTYAATGEGGFYIWVQMPDFRYLVNEWVRSPDALDTSDPEGTAAVWLRNRQRNDGLGGWSLPRAKGTSSRQLSLHNRGYE